VTDSAEYEEESHSVEVSKESEGSVRGSVIKEAKESKSKD